MRLYQALCIFCTIAFVFIGCAGSSSPEDVVQSYLEAKKTGNFKKAYQFVSSKDTSIKSQQQYLTENDNQSRGFVGGWLSDKVSYDIQNVKKDEEEATVYVSITTPDFRKIIGGLMGEAFASAFSGKKPSEEKIQEMIREKYSDGDLPMTTEERTFNAVKDEDGWKVFLNWKANKLLAEANKLREQERLAEAQKKYEAALDLDPGNDEIQQAHAEVSSKVALAKAKNEYISKHLKVEDFRVGEQSRYSFGSPEQAVFGKLRNAGDSTLSEVEVTVYFLNDDDKPIGEENYHPVLVSEFSMSDNKPLKAGYVEDFGYYVEDDAPSEWKGNARAKVTSIDFE